MLFGRSGLGKTSVLRVGTYPLLREDLYLPVHIRLDDGEHAPAPLMRRAYTRRPARLQPPLWAMLLARVDESQAQGWDRWARR